MQAPPQRQQLEDGGAAVSGPSSPPPPEPSLSDLPEDILQRVLRLLDGPELACLCTQDQHLHHLASQQELWQKLALARWPQATATQYGGNWQLLYGHRACLPSGFTGCVDRCHTLTLRAAAPAQLRINGSSLPALASPAGSPAGSPMQQALPGGNVYGFNARPFASIPGMLFDQVMQMLFSTCLWHTRLGAATPGGAGSISTSLSASRSLFGAPASSSSSSSGGPLTSAARQAAALASEMVLVREDMAWWLGSKPEAVFAFARRTADLLTEYDMWGSGFTAWPEALWRRSALQFLADLQLGPQADVCPSVSERLGRELARVDDVMRSVDAEATDLATRPPQGLPVHKHWWYGLRGQLAAPVC